MDELEIFKPRSLFEGGTVSSGRSTGKSNLTFKAMMQMIKELEEKLQETPKIESMLITMYCPDECVLKVKFEEKEYFLISPSTFEKLDGLFESSASDTANSLGLITGIPVMKDDELVGKILREVFRSKYVFPQKYLNPRMG